MLLKIGTVLEKQGWMVTLNIQSTFIYTNRCIHLPVTQRTAASLDQRHSQWLLQHSARHTIKSQHSSHCREDWVLSRGKHSFPPSTLPISNNHDCNCRYYSLVSIKSCTLKKVNSSIKHKNTSTTSWRRLIGAHLSNL